LGSKTIPSLNPTVNSAFSSKKSQSVSLSQP